MYHPTLIARNLEALAQQFLQGKLPPERAVAEVEGMTLQLADAVDKKTGEPARPLSPEEQEFISGELLWSKASYAYWAERYAWCNPPEAPIWMGDLSFKALGDVKIGDEVVGWERKGATLRSRNTRNAGTPLIRQFQRDVLTRAKVLSITRRQAPLVKVTMASGRTIRCTPDHLWSNGLGYERIGTKYTKKDGTVKTCGKYLWITAQPGRTLSHIVDPVYPPTGSEAVRAAGWLGGIYDGEGSSTNISQQEQHNPVVFAEIGRVCTLLGIQATPLLSRLGWNLAGGRQGYVKFILYAQPKRRAKLEEYIFSTRFREADKIVSVVPDGVGEVVSMQTSTGNYTAWGYASKNCSQEGVGIKRMYPLFDSQQLLLLELARLELQRFENQEEEGILVNILKARRLGASTFSISTIVHRQCLQTYVDSLLAADVPSQSSYNFGIYRMMFERLPWWMRPKILAKSFTFPEHLELDNFCRADARSGKALRGTEGERGDIGRGMGLPLVHLTELAKWDETDQIKQALMPAVGYSRRVLVFFESSPRGRGNYWHNHWLHSMAGKGRHTPVFIPWYAEPRKYRRVPPANWRPLDTTLAHARRCEEQGARWLHHPVRLTREQLFWYEFTRLDYEGEDMLSDFLQEYAADPEECFQYSGHGLVSTKVQQEIADSARPLKLAFRIIPAAEKRPQA